MWWAAGTGGFRLAPSIISPAAGVPRGRALLQPDAASRLSQGWETHLHPRAGWGDGGPRVLLPTPATPRRGCPCAAAFPPHPCLHSPLIAGGDNDKPISTLPAVCADKSCPR